MTFFESLVALLLLAVVLLQVARRTWIPYPTMLATAGVIVALVPGTPAIGLEGHTALALFIAPVLLDAAFDFPLAAIRRLWRPLVALSSLDDCASVTDASCPDNSTGTGSGGVRSIPMDEGAVGL